MSLIGRRIKANLTDEFGDVTGEVVGVVLDKVTSAKKVRNQLPQGNGRDGIYYSHVPVDYFLIEIESGVEKVEAIQFMGFPEEDGHTFPYVGP